MVGQSDKSYVEQAKDAAGAASQKVMDTASAASKSVTDTVRDPPDSRVTRKQATRSIWRFLGICFGNCLGELYFTGYYHRTAEVLADVLCRGALPMCFVEVASWQLHATYFDWGEPCSPGIVYTCRHDFGGKCYYINCVNEGCRCTYRHPTNVQCCVMRRHS